MNDDIREWAHNRARYRPAPDIYEAALLDLAPLVEAAREAVNTKAYLPRQRGDGPYEDYINGLMDALAAALRELGVPGVE